VEDDTDTDDSTAVDEEDDDDDSVIIEYEREEGDGQVFLSVCTGRLYWFSMKIAIRECRIVFVNLKSPMNGAVTHKLF
jgi:hypothetical protein